MDAQAMEIVARLISGMVGAVCLWTVVVALRSGETGYLGIRPVQRQEQPRQYWLHLTGFITVGAIALLTALFGTTR